MTNSQLLPPLSQLETWATPRLLRFFKKYRNSVPRRWSYEPDTDPLIKEFFSYLEGVKSILNKKEHVTK